MRILHLSDLHYKSPKYHKFDEDQIMSLLLDNLKKKEKIDLVFITGDLLFSGVYYKHFEEMRVQFLENISKSLEIPLDSILICPGNHEVNREVVLKSITSFFKNEIKDNKSLNDFINLKNPDYLNSIIPFENYNKFLKSFHTGPNDFIEDL